MLNACQLTFESQTAAQRKSCCLALVNYFWVCHMLPDVKLRRSVPEIAAIVLTCGKSTLPVFQMLAFPWGVF